MTSSLQCLLASNTIHQLRLTRFAGISLRSHFASLRSHSFRFARNSLRSQRPEFVGKVVLIQIGISAFERGDDYLGTRAEVVRLTKKINANWPGTVQFQECQESEMRLLQRMALLRAADICIVTSLRDGLSRLPLEFAVAHQDALSSDSSDENDEHDGSSNPNPNPKPNNDNNDLNSNDENNNNNNNNSTNNNLADYKPGTIILSEFSSCCRVMRGALVVNPWRISEIAYAIERALCMVSERSEFSYITSYLITSHPHN